MGNFRTITKRLFNFGLVFGLSLALTSPLSARNAATVPSELKRAIGEIERSANRQNVARVMNYYSSDFTNSDGLDYSTLSAALKNFWQQYPTLKYRTEIKSWQREGDRAIVETLTSMEGTTTRASRQMRLSAEVRSRQHFLNGKIVKQEILSEKTEIVTGDNPPQLIVNLPEQVQVGQQFSFDAIVREPLGEEILFGAAIGETTNSSLYLDPSSLELELLPAGGIFKLVTAPITPENRWYSAIIARSDGIAIVTQRVAIEN